MGRPRLHPKKGTRDIIQQLAATGGEPIGIAARLGVSLEVFQTWMRDHPTLQHAFDLGRDEQRHALHCTVLQAAKKGITAGNRNAIFLLGTMYAGLYKEIEPTEVSIERDSNVNVMTVIDHGSDAEWERLASMQQTSLIQDVNVTHERPSTPPPLPLARRVTFPDAVPPPPSPRAPLPSWYPHS